MKRWLVIILIGLAAAGTTLPTQRLTAQSSASFALTSGGIFAGGGSSSGSSFSVWATAGQAAAGTSNSATFGIEAGFSGAPAATSWQVFVPALVKNYATGW